MSSNDSAGSATPSLLVTTSPQLSDFSSRPATIWPVFKGPAAHLAAVVHAALRSTGHAARVATMRAASNQTSSPSSTTLKVFDVALVAHPSTSGKITPPIQNAGSFATRKTSAATSSREVPGPPHGRLAPVSINGREVPFTGVQIQSHSTAGSDDVSVNPSTSLANMFASQLTSFPDDLNVTPLGYWEFLDIASMCTGDDILNPIWNTLFKEVAAVNHIFDPWRCYELCKSTKYIFPDPRVTTTPLGLGSVMPLAPTIFGSMAEVTAGLASFIRIEHRLTRDVYVPPAIEQVLHFIAYRPHAPPLPPGQRPLLVPRPPPQPIPSTPRATIQPVALKGYHFYGHSSVGPGYAAQLAVCDAVNREVGAYAGPLASLQGQIVARMYGAWQGDRGFCYPRDCYCWFLLFEYLHPWHKGMQFAYGPTFSHLPTSDKIKVYNLYKTLHSAGVVHNNLDMRHILQAEDGRLCLISFEKSSYDVPGSSSGHRRRLREALVAEGQDLLVELGWYNRDGSPTPDCLGVSWPLMDEHGVDPSDGSFSSL